MKQNIEKSRLQVQGPKRYLLNGKLFKCNCGLSMVGTSIKGSRYYRCTSINNRIDHTRRCRLHLRADDIERRVWSLAEHIYSDPSTILQYAAQEQSQNAVERERIQAELVSVKAALATCENELRNIFDSVQVGLYSVMNGKERSAGVEQRSRELEKHRQALEEKLDSLDLTTDEVAGNAVTYVEHLLKTRLETELTALETGTTGAEDLTGAQRAMWRQDAVEQYTAELAERRSEIIRETLRAFSLEERQKVIAALGLLVTCRPDLPQKIAVELPIPIHSLGTTLMYSGSPRESWACP
jgi:hypothetical protein